MLKSSLFNQLKPLASRFFSILFWLALSIATWAENETEDGTNQTDTPASETETTTDNQGNTETSTPSSATKPKLKNIEHQQMQLIAKQIPSDNAIWLKSDDEEILGIYTAESYGNLAGAIVVIYNMENYAFHAKVMNQLSTELPDHGWSTLAIPIQLPKETQGFVGSIRREADMAQPNGQNPTDETETIDNKSTDDSETTVANTDDAPSTATDSQQPTLKTSEQLTTQNHKRIQAAISHFEKMGIYNTIIVAINNTAETTFSYISDLIENHQAGTLLAVRGFIVINQHHSVEPTLFYANSSLITDLPILDIFIGPNNTYNGIKKSRNSAIKREKFKLYHQINIPNFSPITHKSNHFTERIRAWLRVHAESMTTQQKTAPN